jgi:hypothetical protein
MVSHKKYGFLLKVGPEYDATPHIGKNLELNPQVLGAA